MGVIYIRPPIERKSLIPQYGLEIGERGDRWEEEFIKNIDFSTMDNATDWSYLFQNSKAYDFDLSEIDSGAVTNMNYMFNGVNAGNLKLKGLVIGANTSAINLLSGSFNSIDFTGAKFYSLPSQMFNGATVLQGIQLVTMDVSNLTSLSRMFENAQLASLNLTGFNTSTITDMSYMFNSAEIPIIIGLNTLDYSHVTTTYNMFNYSKIPNINMSGITFSSLVNAGNMFYGAVGELSRNNIQGSINLSNCRFPIIENAGYMFYNYMYNNIETDLDISGTIFNSTAMNAEYMFAYIQMPSSTLDLSGFVNAKITNSNYMFGYTTIGETDFTPLDFSEMTNAYAYTFNECVTPVIYLKSTMPYDISQYSTFYMTYRNKADEIIYELSFPPSVSQLSYVVYPQYSEPQITTSYLFKNSVINASNLSYFVYSDYYPIESVVFENTTINVGNNGSLYNFLRYSYNGESVSEVVFDMRDVTFNGIVANSNNLMGYGCSFDKIYFPNTGINFSGQLYYFGYGISKWDPDTQTSIYKSPILYNLDKLDMSRIQSIQYLLYYFNGDYDFSSWDVGNVTSIQYLLQYCYGNYDFSNWDTQSLERISTLAYELHGNLDVRNWDLSNVNYIYGISNFYNGSIDFDGWEISSSRSDIQYCYLIDASNTSDTKTIYLPNTLFKPTSYSGLMFGGQTYGDSIVWVVDVYTNATDIETQGWTFGHIYTSEEPYGYRLHLNTTHNDFLNAIGGD